MLMDHIVVAFLWILYGVLHSVLAGLRVKNFFKKRLGEGYKHYRLAYNIFALVSLGAIVWFQFSIQSKNFFYPTLLTRIAGSLFVFTGLAIMFFCIKKYFMGLSGLKSLFHEQVRQELIVSGVHRYVRHPLYLGTFIFLWGLVIVFPTFSLLTSTSIITFYTFCGIRLEENKLVNDFGDQYRHYQQTVPKLIPKIHTAE